MTTVAFWGQGRPSTHAHLVTPAGGAARSANGSYSGAFAADGAAPLCSRFFRVAELNDKPTDYAGLSNPYPSINAIGARGDIIVTSIHGVTGLLQSADAGRSWDSVCVNTGEVTAITGDRQGIQLAVSLQQPGGPNQLQTAWSYDTERDRIAQRNLQ